MRRLGIAGQRLAALFILGCVLLNYPILFLFSRDEHVASIPLLYAYVFGAWAALIALMAWFVETSGR